MLSNSSSCGQLFLSLAIFELCDSQYLFPIDFDEIKDEINMFFPLILSLKNCIPLSKLLIRSFNKVITVELKSCVVGGYCFFKCFKMPCFNP